MNGPAIYTRLKFVNGWSVERRDDGVFRIALYDPSEPKRPFFSINGTALTTLEAAEQMASERNPNGYR